MSWLLLYVVFGWLIRAAMVPVVLRRRLAPGAALAWLGIVFLHPYFGLALYLLIGETRLGARRSAFHRKMVSQFRHREESAAAQAKLPPIYEPMVLQAQKISGMPPLPGNAVEFFTESRLLVDRLIADIDAAQAHVHLLYYIFANDQVGQRVASAVCKAASRGVQCRVLVDAVASRTFFRHSGLAHQLMDAKVEVAPALPVAILRRGLPRMDLRNHRKLALIDDRVAYAGSHNLVDPSYGGQPAAPWVDVTGRFCGPVIAELSSVFCEDWGFETGKILKLAPAASIESGADIPMQVVPTGPSDPAETFRRVLLAAIQCARSKVIITTPYFVPDEPTLVALLMAADRGVDVSLVLPKRPDHAMTAAAGRAHFDSLMDAGVHIFLYRPGLLHSKTTTVDNAFAVFGSANVDVRSFNLNFELSILMYGSQITGQVRAVQESYLRDSDAIDPKQWASRPVLRKYADGAISLLSPLL